MKGFQLVDNSTVFPHRSTVKWGHNSQHAIISVVHLVLDCSKG